MKNIFNKIWLFVSRILHGSSGPKTPIIENHPAGDQLRSVITAVKEQASDAQVDLGNLGSRLQTYIDIADAALPLIPYIDPADIEEISVIWDDALRQTGVIRHSVQNIESDSDTLGGTVSLTSVTTSGSFSRHIPFEVNPDFHKAWSRYIVVTSRPTLKDEVTNLLRTFYLDIAPSGKQSPLEYFETAHRAFESPISEGNPAITSLIPMREAVETALDELLKLRPQQEATGKSHGKKMFFICKQLKKDAVSDVVVQEWVDQWQDISDRDLSASKRYRMTRDEWSRKLNRATLFLHSFLTGLDPHKLRK